MFALMCAGGNDNADYTDLKNDLSTNIYGYNPDSFLLSTHNLD